MGDFNAKHPMWYNSDTNKLGDRLSNYLNNSTYAIANNDMYTYKKSIIDLTLIKDCKNLVSNWSAYPEVFINTDHTMIMFNLSLKVEKANKPTWNTRKADWEVWKNRSKQTYQVILDKMAGNDEQDIDGAYGELKQSIIDLGNECIGKTESKSNSKPWWNREIGLKYKEYKICHQELKKRCDQEKVDRYKVAKNNFLESYHEARQKYLEETITQLDGDDQSMWKAIRRFNNVPNDYVIQPLTDIDGTILSTDEEIASEFTRQYGESQLMVEPEREEEIRRQAEEILRQCEQEGESDEINGEITLNEGFLTDVRRNWIQPIRGY